jgi:membrane fusion protein (multidrug efflux system)
MRIIKRLLPVGLMIIVCAAAAPPPPAVTVQKVTLQNVAPVQTYIGYVQAIQQVSVMARVSAFIDKVAFTEGSMVKAGQVLYELQKPPFEAALESAQAKLQGAEATLRNAQLNVERDSHLITGSVVSRQQLDTDTATRDADQATVLSDRTDVETAAINLSYCTITSPIDGQIGKTTYTQGNLVSTSSSALATVVQLDPIRVEFAVADGDILNALVRSHKSLPDLKKEVDVRLKLANGETYGSVGQIEFLNNQVDADTGTVTVWARFANPDNLLVPGAFATVDVQRATPDSKPVVPVEAVQDDKSGKFVLVVGGDNKVKSQKVTTGAQVGQNFVVNSGLSGGEDVIVEGIQKTHPGQVVNPSLQSSEASGATDAPGHAQPTPAKKS